MKTTLLTILFSALFAIGVTAQTTAFTFQGSLKDGASPANGNYDLEFKLFDAVSAGTQQGSTLQRLNIAVANGVFTVSLDFGAGTLPGADRFLDIAVRTSGGGAFTPLSPRQQVNSAPYAVRSLNATTADSVAAGGIPSGSGNYIQNGTSQQASSNFNVSGVGRAGTLRATTIDSLGEYQILGTRILRAIGNNTSLGANAGDAGFGTLNTYLGTSTGAAATSNAMQNTFAGTFAGANNSDGVRNSFFGARAGISNTFGNNNTFTGEGAGPFNTSGTDNSFFGSDAGQSNSTGSRNSYFGTWAGGLPAVTDASAFGYRAFVTQNNSLILGSINGVNGATADTNVGIGTTAPSQKLHVVGNGLFTGDMTVNGTLNATLPANSVNYIQNSTTTQAASNFNISGTGSANILSATTQFNIGTNRILSNAGDNNLFAGVNAGLSNTNGSANAFFGNSAGKSTTTGGNNSFFGAYSGWLNTTGVGNSFFGLSAGESNQTGNRNAYFGEYAGWKRTGSFNSVFGGTDIGSGDGSGDYNSFFGYVAGALSRGNFNTFIGMGSGYNNATGSSNTFVGRNAGDANSTGTFNTVLGEYANLGSGALTNSTAIGNKALVSASNSLVLGSINGVNGATADTNVGIGTTTPSQKLHVVGNGLFSGNLDALQFNRNGARILGVGAATDTLYSGIESGDNVTNENSNTFLGAKAGSRGSTTSSPTAQNAFVGFNAGRSVYGSQNTFFGAEAGSYPSTLRLFNGVSLFGYNSRAQVGVTDSAAIGANAFVGTSGSLVLGSINGVNGAFTDTNVGIGTTAPLGRLDVRGQILVGLTTAPSIPAPNALFIANDGGDANNTLRIDGDSNGMYMIARSNPGAVAGAALVFRTGDTGQGETDRLRIEANGNVNIGTVGTPDKLGVNGSISFATLGGAGSTQLCRNVQNQISTCSSSLRYKKNISGFTEGMSFVRQLSPITFDWKDGGMKDVGFGAEDIANIDPHFVTYNDKGEVEGVKYDRLSVAFVNAFKEQQEQIETLQKTNVQQQQQIEKQQALIESQQRQNDELRKQVERLRVVVCSIKADADICKSK